MATDDRSGADGPANVFSGVADQVVQAGSVYGGVHFHGDRTDLRPRRSQLRADIADFTDRTTELELLSDLLRDDDQPSTVCITGPGGVGKTALALRLAHRLSVRLSFAQLYADLRGSDDAPEDPAETLGRFLLVLGARPTEIPPGVVARGDLFRALLWGRAAIVVLDNARDESQVRPLLPGSPECRVVVTSRQPLYGLEAASVFELGVFGEAAAVELLTKVAGHATDLGDAAPQLARLCGNLPLALRITGIRAGAHQGASLASLTVSLADDRTRLAQLKVGDLDIRASFHAGYGRLRPPLDRFFRHLSLLPGPEFSSDTAAMVLRLDRAAAQDAIFALVDTQMVERTATGRFVFHDLVRLFGRELAHEVDTEEERKAVLERAVVAYGEQADALFRQAPYEDAPTPEGLAWFDAEEANVLAVLREGYAAGLWKAVLGLAEAVRDFFRFRGLLTEAEEVLRLGLEASRAARAADGEVTMVIYLAMLLREAGRGQETPALYRRGLAVAEQAGAEGLRAWLQVHWGDALIEAGEPEEAVVMVREALANPAWRDDGEKQAWALGHLGMAYHACGRHDEALAVLEQAWRSDHERGDELRAGWALVHRATVLTALGHWRAAEDALDTAYRQGRRSGDRMRQAWVLQNMAALYQARGDTGRALAAASEIHGLAVAMRNESLAETADNLRRSIAAAATEE